MQFKGGVKEAAKLLQGLDPIMRTKVFDIIKKQDPNMAEILEKEMVVFDDLKYITQQMLYELLKEINPDDLALALKVASKELQEHILNNLSKRVKEDFLEVLNGPLRVVRDVLEASERVMLVVRKKVDKGELVLSPDHEKYV